jgi:Transglycosylase SLT domain
MTVSRDRIRRALIALAGGSLIAVPAGAAAQTTTPTGTTAAPPAQSAPPTTTAPPTAPPPPTAAPNPVLPDPTTSSTTTGPPVSTPTAASNPVLPTPDTTPAAPPPAPPKVLTSHTQSTSSGTSTLTHLPAATGSPQAKPHRAKKAPTPQTAAAAQSGLAQIALPPSLLANRLGVLPTSALAGGVSDAALRFYRIPLFLLPIYQAAGIQYGVPWQVLAAINEVETDYGRDLNISSAGAEGWMQFLPETWLQYGVDANNAGLADPYNPADAIFAAARYLRAAGAVNDLRGAIYAYNHSTEYVASVLLRAQLIAAYPQAVIGALTGLTQGRLPAADATVDLYRAGQLPAPSLPRPTTPGAPGTGILATGALTDTASLAASAAVPVRGRQAWVELRAPVRNSVVAVQDGRVIALGHTHRLGTYVRLRDLYGNVYTYAALGHLAKVYKAPTTPSASALRKALVEREPLAAPPPRQAASAGAQPQTLQVTAPPTVANLGTQRAGSGKARLFAQSNSSFARRAADIAGPMSATRWLPLHVGSVVTAGTALATLRGGRSTLLGSMRFAITPGGSERAVDPRPILDSWRLLGRTLGGAPEGLVGATAGEVFLQTRQELEQQVLSDPGISIYSCGREDIAAGMVDRRVLAALEFLSRVGLKPTVSALRCGVSTVSAEGRTSLHAIGDAVDISAINGIPIARHQGVGSITDHTIRALLTLQGPFVPHDVFSLMRYPGAPNTHAVRDAASAIRIDYLPEPATTTTTGSRAATLRALAVPAMPTAGLNTTQWISLIQRAGAIQNPVVAQRPSTAAVPDNGRPRSG